MGWSSKATDANAISLGYDSTATNQSSVSLGSGADATGKGALAVGNDAYATGQNATAVGAGNHDGSGASATATGASAFGYKSSASGVNSLALGISSSTGAKNSVAIGDSAVVNANNTGAIVIGHNARSQYFGAAENYVIAIGGNSNSYAYSVALGKDATADRGGYDAEAGAIAIGYKAETTDGSKAGVAIGNQAKVAAGTNSIAIGTKAFANQTGSSALGDSANVTGEYAIALGSSAQAAGWQSTAIGYNAQTQKYRSVALGTDSSVTGDYGSAIGYAAKSSQANALAIGTKSIANATSSIAIGDGANIIYSNGLNAIAIGKDSKVTPDQNAKNSDAVSIGTGAQTFGIGAYALGANSYAISDGAIAFGDKAVSGGDPSSYTNTTDGNGVTTRTITVLGKNTVAIGSNSNATGDNAIAVGAKTTVAGDNGVAIGHQAIIDKSASGSTTLNAVSIGTESTVRGSNSIAIGNLATVAQSGTSTMAINSIAIGESAQVTAASSIALGSKATALATDTISIGRDANASFQRAIAIGTAASSKNDSSIAIGWKSAANLNNSMSIGVSSIANASTALALGWQANASGSLSTAFGPMSTAVGYQDIALGRGTYASGSNSLAIGTYSNASAVRATAIGANSIASATNAVAVGKEAQASKSDAIAIGTNSNAAGVNAIALGINSKASSANAIAIGNGNIVTGQNSGAFGDPNTISGNESYATGNNNTIAQNNTFVIGNNVTTTQANSVVLGANSTDRAATTETGTTIRGNTYTFAGQGSAANGVVSVGKAGAERQIINVAAGKVSSTSTDAINGSQLYAAYSALNNLVTSSGVKYFSVNSTGGGNINNDGAIGLNAIAIGKDVQAVSNGGISIGYEVGLNAAGGPQNIAIGSKIAPAQYLDLLKDAQSNGGYATKNKNAFFRDVFRNTTGYTANAYATSVGTGSNTGSGSYNVAIGPNSGSYTTGSKNTAVGNLAGIAVIGNQNTALGDRAGVDVRGDLNVGIGLIAGTNVNGSENLALGSASGTVVNGNNNLALGAMSGQDIFGNYNIAIGSGAGNGIGTSSRRVSNTIAIGIGAVVKNQNSMALGYGSNASVAQGDVALGSNSVTSATIGVSSLNINGDAYAVAGTNPASAVSIGQAGAERQLQNVAAGRVLASSTDAINGSQLYAVQQVVESGLNFEADNGSTISLNLGQTLSIVGGQGNTTTSYSGYNVTTTTDNFGNLHIQIADSPVFTSVVAGNSSTGNLVTLDSDGIKVSNPNNSTGDIIIADGNVNFGGATLSNIGNAINDNDAVNLSQLNAATNAVATHYFSVNSTGGGNFNNDGATGADAIAIGKDSLSGGTGAVSMGLGSQVVSGGNGLDSKGAVAIGLNSNSMAQGAVAVGSGAFAMSEGALAFGQNSVSGGIPASYNYDPLTNQYEWTTIGKNTIAIGVNSNATQDGAIAIGYDAHAEGGQGGIAIGDGAYSYFGSTALGAGSIANGMTSVALGRNSVVNGVNATAVGVSVFANGFQSAALGAFAEANGDFSTALGYFANAAGNGAIALGGAYAGNDGDIAVGTGANAMGADSIAIGSWSQTIGANSIALGNYALANGISAVAIGDRNQALANNAIAVGLENTVESYKGSAFGHKNLVKDYHGLALGHDSYVEGENTTSIGSDNFIQGNQSIVAGSNNAVTGILSTVSGHNNQIGSSTYDADTLTPTLGAAANTVVVSGTENKVYSDDVGVFGSYNAVAAGVNDTFILGNNVRVDASASDMSVANGAIFKGSVALGNSSSISAPTATPSYTNNGVTYNFAGTSPVGTVSVGAVGNERTITNVAAGRISSSSTDAINGSQLYAVESTLANAISQAANSELNFKGNSGAVVTKNAGQTLGIVGATLSAPVLAASSDTATAGEYSAKNIQTVSTVDGIQIQMSERPEFDGVVAGSTVSGNVVTLDSNGIKVSNPNNSTGDIVIADGNVNFGGNTLSNVGAGSIGDGSKDAINGDQIHDLVGAGAYGGGDTIANIGGTGATNINDAVQTMNDSLGKGWNAKDKAGNAFNVAMGDTVSFVNSDGNINIVAATGQTLSFDLARDLNVGSVTAGDTVSGNYSVLGSAGTTVTDASGNQAVYGANAASLSDATGNTVTTIGAGNISIVDGAGNTTTVTAAGTTVQDGSNEATYGADGIRLGDAAGNTYITIAEGNVDFGGNTLSNVAAGTSLTDATNLGQVQDLVSQAGSSLTSLGLNFAGNAGTTHLNLGEELSIVGKATTAGTYSGQNVQTVIDTNGDLQIEIADNPLFDSVTAGDTVSGNYSVLGSAGTTVTDASGNQAVYGANAASLSDNAGNTTTITAAGNTIVDGNGNTYSTTAGGSTISNSTGDVTELTAAGTAVSNQDGDNAVYGAEGIVITDASTGNVITIQDGNVSFGGNTLSNVAAGTSLTDATNLGQVQDLVKNAGSGLTSLGMNFAGNSGLVHRDLGATLSIVGAQAAASNVTESNDAAVTGDYSAKNIQTTVTKDGAVQIQMAEAPELAGLKVGDASSQLVTVDNQGINITGATGNKVAVTDKGLTIAGGPSVTVDGIDAGGKVISNVADGVAGTDAVNVNQLNKVITNTTAVINKNIGDVEDLFDTFDVSGQQTTDRQNIVETINAMNATGIKYAHTNGVPEVDEHGKIGVTNDSSAGGKNSSAFGVNAIIEAGADSSVAMGHNSFVSSAATNAIAIGSGAQAMGQSAIALGHGAVASGTQSISVGTGNIVSGNHSGAFGDPNTISGDGSYAVGNNNTIAANNSFVMGNNVTIDSSAASMSSANGASFKGSVGLGNGSTVEAPVATTGVTIQGSDYQFAGAKPVGTVSVGAKDEERTITNVAAGRVTAESTDAVNGSQLYATNQAIENIKTGGAGAVQYSDADSSSTPNGGKPSNNVTLVGANADAPVTLSNVADGRAPNDAVNVNQLNQMGNSLNNRISDVEDNANAGTATAMAVAGLPQAYLPGKSMVAVSGGVYRGQTGYAVGYSTISESGNWVIKASASGNSQGHFGGTAGVGYQW